MQVEGGKWGEQEHPLGLCDISVFCQQPAGAQRPSRGELRGHPQHLYNQAVTRERDTLAREEAIQGKCWEHLTKKWEGKQMDGLLELASMEYSAPHHAHSLVY